MQGGKLLAASGTLVQEGLDANPIAESLLLNRGLRAAGV